MSLFIKLVIVQLYLWFVFSMLTLLLSGCGASDYPDYTTKYGTDVYCVGGACWPREHVEAVQDAMADSCGGRRSYDGAIVRFVEDKIRLSCSRPAGQWPNACYVFGWYEHSTDTAWVWSPFSASVAETSMTHELMHRHLRLHGDYDPRHDNEIWQCHNRTIIGLRRYYSE